MRVGILGAGLMGKVVDWMEQISDEQYQDRDVA